MYALTRAEKPAALIVGSVALFLPPP